MSLFGRIRAARLIWKAASAQGRGDHREAAAHAESALAVAPGSRAAAFLAAENSLHIRDHAGARRILESALVHHPGQMHFSILLARTMEHQGEPLERILPHVETYLKERQRSADSHDGGAARPSRVLSRPAEAAKVEERVNNSREALDSWAEEIAARAQSGKARGETPLTKPPVSLT